MKYLIIFLIAITLSSTSCSVLNFSADPYKVLTGNTWEVSELLGSAVNPLDFSKGLPNLSFSSDGKLNGFGGCNTLISSFEVLEDKLDLKPVAATRMACEGVRESEFLNVLERTNAYKVDKGKLYLMEGSTILIGLKSKSN
jgi:heat shock protein HslJ